MNISHSAAEPPGGEAAAMPPPRGRQRGVAADARARFGRPGAYASDWLGGGGPGQSSSTVEATTAAAGGKSSRSPAPSAAYLVKRLLLPASANVFAASALPAVAFGVQLAAATDGALTPAHTLLATAAASVAQALVGGQPLLVVGVAEPIVIIWAFLAAFCRARALAYLPFCAWTCAFAAAFLAVAALAGLANRTVRRFTRFSCETFGTVISILFCAVSVKGLVDEFAFPPQEQQQQQQQLLPLVNGLWAVLVALGTALTALALVGRARHWRAGWPWLRAPLSDYGALISVVAWTAASFAVPRIEEDAGAGSIPHRVPRFDVSAIAANAAATAPKMLTGLPGWAVAAALVPGLVVAVLFWFDHTVSSRMAHDAGGHPLVKPTAYDYDLLLCAVITLVLGLVGCPPTNGVIPQTPILSRSLLLPPPSALPPRGAGGGGGGGGVGGGAGARSGKGGDPGSNGAAGRGPRQQPPPPPPSPAPHAVLESRWPNLAQGLLMALCLPLVPSVLPLVPLSVVWGFFLFLAIEPLRGMQLWRDQVWALATDAKTRRAAAFARRRRHPHARGLAAAFCSSFSSTPRVPMAAVGLVTLIQVAWALGVSLLALLAGVAGVAFPVPLALLVPLRALALPRAFSFARCLGGPAALEAIDPLRDPDALLTDAEEEEEEEEEEVWRE